MKNIIEIATLEIGVKEVSGDGSNPRILQYARETGFKNYQSDESSWCSLFINWCAEQAGLERSFSLAARSWLRVGIPVTDPEPGDIAVFWRVKRESWQGHVAIFTGFARNGRIYCLGGNQNNQVSISARTEDKLLGFRRLRPSSEIHFPRKTLKKGSSGPLVTTLQDALKILNFDVGTSDGAFGSRTEQALKDFQSTNENLKINGVFDEATRKYMEAVLNGAESIKKFLDILF
jgi:uncharacterized protein (TIGR02594 family)